MEILDSLEVRWFLSETTPALPILKTWFEAAADEGERVDDYLLTGRNDVGFKFRRPEGKPAKIEIKYLIGSLGTVSVAENITGNLERWRKLSLESDGDKLKTDNNRWCTVKKERRLRKFEFKQGVASEVPAKDFPHFGCGVELTKLGLTVPSKGVGQWTFGLEAFGPGPLLLEIFQATSRETFGKGLKVEIGKDKSLNYPQWLEGT